MITMYFPEEDDNTHFVIDSQYGLEEGDYFSEYEVSLMRLASMRITNTPMVVEIDFTEERLAFMEYEDETELAERRRGLKRHLSEEDQEDGEAEAEAVPSKRRKLNNEKSEEEGEPGVSQACSDGSGVAVDENANMEAEKEEMTNDV